MSALAEVRRLAMALRIGIVRNLFVLASLVEQPGVRQRRDTPCRAAGGRLGRSGGSGLCAPGFAFSTSDLTMRPRGPVPDSAGKIDALLRSDAAGQRRSEDTSPSLLGADGGRSGRR